MVWQVDLLVGSGMSRSPAAGGMSSGRGVEHICAGQLQVSPQLDELAQLGGPMLWLLV